MIQITKICELEAWGKFGIKWEMSLWEVINSHDQATDEIIIMLFGLKREEKRYKRTPFWSV